MKQESDEGGRLVVGMSSIHFSTASSRNRLLSICRRAVARTAGASQIHAEILPHKRKGRRRRVSHSFRYLPVASWTLARA